jgi:hypothetical protein
MTRWSAITRTRGRRSALAYGSRSTPVAEDNLNRLVHHERGRYCLGRRDHCLVGRHLAWQEWQGSAHERERSGTDHRFVLARAMTKKRGRLGLMLSFGRGVRAQSASATSSSVVTPTRGALAIEWQPSMGEDGGRHQCAPLRAPLLYAASASGRRAELDARHARGSSARLSSL